MKLQFTKKKLKQLSGYQILNRKMTMAVTGAYADAVIKPETHSMDTDSNCSTSNNQMR